MQQACVVVEAEQQRAHDVLSVEFVRSVAKPADDAVGAAKILDLLHAVAIAGLVWQIETLGDDAVKTAAGLREPFFRRGIACRCRRESKGGLRSELYACKGFQRRSPLAEGLLCELAVFCRGQKIKGQK